MSSPLVSVINALSGDIALLPFQTEIAEAVEKYDRLCVVAARQIGKSETLLRIALAWAQSKDNQLILIVSASERQAQEILTRLKAAIYSQKYPTQLSKESATEIALSRTGSRILSLPNSPNTVRGFAADLLIIDETDSIEQWEEFSSALFPSVARKGGRVLCSGTYFGKRQLYNLSKDPTWKTFIFPYTVNPPKDLAQQKHDLTPSRFAQEFDCIPIDAASTLFPFELLDSCTGNDGDNYPKPIPGALYFGGWDPAKLQDASMFYVLELPEGGDRLRVKVIKDYHGMKYSEQAAEIAEMHKYLHFYRVNIDCTGVGQGPMETLETKIGSVVNGVTFTQNVKQQLFNDLRIAFQDRQIQIWASDTILRRELHDLNPDTLKLESGSPDRACALALAWSGAKEAGRSYQIKDPRTFNASSLSPDSFSDLGSLALGKNGFYSIVRLWLDSRTGKRHLVEVWRKATHPADALKQMKRLHDKRSFEAIGIDAKLYESLESLIDESALPFQVLDDAPDASVEISSGLADGSLLIADHIINNGAVWSQLSNVQSDDDDVRLAACGASALCMQVF